jgi:hypothetical protein
VRSPAAHKAVHSAAHRSRETLALQAIVEGRAGLRRRAGDRPPPSADASAAGGAVDQPVDHTAMRCSPRVYARASRSSSSRSTAIKAHLSLSQRLTPALSRSLFFIYWLRDQRRTPPDNQFLHPTTEADHSDHVCHQPARAPAAHRQHRTVKTRVAAGAAGPSSCATCMSSRTSSRMSFHPARCPFSPRRQSRSTAGAPRPRRRSRSPRALPWRRPGRAPRPHRHRTPSRDH